MKTVECVIYCESVALFSVQKKEAVDAALDDGITCQIPLSQLRRMQRVQKQFHALQKDLRLRSQF